MKKWNQINKRLKSILAEGLNVAFNHSPVVKTTYRDKYCISFFHVKFNGEVIWQYPKDNAYHNFRFCDKYIPYDDWERPWQGGQEKKIEGYANKQFASPENIVAGYLDMPKDKLLEFDEPAGLRYILWACDKRIGKNKLSQMEFIKQALPIVRARVPEYNLEPCFGNSMTLVYSDEDINIFGKSKWAFNSTWNDDYLKTHRFIVADNASYSLSKHAIEIDFNGQISKWYPKMFSKNVFKLTTDTEQKILKALKSPSKNLEGKTVWEELIFLENLYPTIKEIVPEDLELFSEITQRQGNYV